MNIERAILLNKFPKELIYLLRDANACIAGGAITSVFTNKPINDYDIYFPKMGRSFYDIALQERLQWKNFPPDNLTYHQHNVLEIIKFLHKEIGLTWRTSKFALTFTKNNKIISSKEQDMKRLENLMMAANVGFPNVRSNISAINKEYNESMSAITYPVNTVELEPIQLIDYFSGTANEIINNFDLNVCMGAYSFREEKFVFSDTFFEDIESKKLKIKNFINPIDTLGRVCKYRSRGYSLPFGEYLKLKMTVDVQLSDPEWAKEITYSSTITRKDMVLDQLTELSKEY